MSSRFALYLAPPPGSALWRFGSRVLGRDAATGAAIVGFAPEGYSPDAWRKIADEPRRYGFHATLKAPMRLAPGKSPEQLEAAIAELSREFAPFDLGPLEASVLKAGDDLGFVALTPSRRSADLAELEARALIALDPFRAPATEAEIARRRPERLTERQRGHLAAYGYPYVLEDFRLHFTLTRAVSAPEKLAEKLAREFAREVSNPSLRIDALVLFEQSAGDEFRIRRRFALVGN